MAKPDVVTKFIRLDPLLHMLQRRGLHSAVVVDKYGGTAGIVSLKGVVELHLLPPSWPAIGL